jgi:predicted outer membrane repeat protein
MALEKPNHITIETNIVCNEPGGAIYASELTLPGDLFSSTNLTARKG